MPTTGIRVGRVGVLHYHDANHNTLARPSLAGRGQCRVTEELRAPGVEDLETLAGVRVILPGDDDPIT
jgi:hypothetical protein